MNRKNVQFVGLRRAADVVQPAGGEHAAAPVAEELAGHRQERTRTKPVLRMKREIHALIGKIVQVEAAIRGHGKVQPRRVPDTGNAHARAVAFLQPFQSDSSQLVDVAEVL
ncbi:hypothetical protein SDC9_212083 [bioreactor metagenome]|uniref:Uncharacterized protein n=1 Tax=bioreactor metagenome TaxID=1076179 RepID=A0A645JLZ9_9ZZZZ